VFFIQKRLRKIIRDTKQLFSLEFLDKVARETGFIARKGKIDAATFLSFNSFLGEDICENTLSGLISKLSSNYKILLSPQALNERFNDNAVEYMREVFNRLMAQQNKILDNNFHFNRILINDSTLFSLSEKFSSEFKGVGGSSKSSIKIQLQYDLLSGNFSCCEPMSGAINDATYIDEMNRYTKPGDLRLADLGYYKIDYLKNVHKKGAFYISKIKSTTPLYIKNSNPKQTKKGKIVKSSEYTRIDALEIIKPLADGETIELKDIYIGSNKELKSRLIITKLSEDNKRKRNLKYEKVLEHEKRKATARSSAWTALNAYITNIPEEILYSNQVHEIYSLRWQVEIMFKVWKSIFKISNTKNSKSIKIQRFKCFLYGRLISILFSSGIVFAAKDIIHDQNLNNNTKEVSDLKAFKHVKEFLPSLRIAIFEDEISILLLLNTIIITIQRFGMKSIRKGNKSITRILEYIAI
jgi:hypothetical protein